MSSGLASIDCYSCFTRNGTDVNCEDPMAAAFVPLEKKCMVPKEHHIGTFPGNFCIKMMGVSGQFRIVAKRSFASVFFK